LSWIQLLGDHDAVEHGAGGRVSILIVLDSAPGPHFSRKSLDSLRIKTDFIEEFGTLHPSRPRHFRPKWSFPRKDPAPQAINQAFSYGDGLI